jgi:DNA-directed RNA polymerase subunit beta
MTERGTFIINGAERIIVSQLHRSPACFSMKSLIPTAPNCILRASSPEGSWVEFTTDINDLMIVYIDRRKKFLVTTLLRAVGFATDRDILDTFELTQKVDLRTAGSEIIGSASSMTSSTRRRAR